MLPLTTDLLAMRKLWIQLRSSLWFVPSMLVLVGIVSALGLVELDLRVGESLGWGKLRPLFASGAEGARGMLSAIASSMITVAGVAFSVTIVTLSLASTQYTPRLVRNFMRDRANQYVLGVFVGIYVYCLIVLRTIRSEDDDGSGFVPLVSVFVGILLAILSIGCLIFFIHHVATSIQASSILEMITRETREAVDAVYPNAIGSGAVQEVLPGDAPPSAWSAVTATRTGYIQNVHYERLLELAREHSLTMRIEQAPGTFVISGATLIATSFTVKEETTEIIRKGFVVGDFRTVQQDPGFGIRQIVDIAMKALSPGINDTSTAVSCLDYLSAILCKIAQRDLNTPRLEGEEPWRLILPTSTFGHYVAKALDEVRLSSRANVTILLQMLELIRRVGAACTQSFQKEPLRRHAQIIAEEAERTVVATYDRERINEELSRTRTALQLSEDQLPLIGAELSDTARE